MGQQQSKEELLFQQINYRNIEGIKSLHRNGASLECVDREGRTPLVFACMNQELYSVAKTLIELGANVNAYRPGRHGGTPLHHAAKRGLAPTVELLLTNGANSLLVNDDCQTPLEVARAKGFNHVVRMIEGHVCLFAGWLRELYGPSILERLAPQLLSKKVWVVVVPCGSRNLQKPFKLELAIYTSLQDAKPRMTIPLWKANMEDPSFSQHEYTLTISEPSSKARIKLAPLNASDIHQLLQICDACKGIPQVMHTAFPFNAPTTFAPMTAPPPPPPSEDADLAMAINASLQSAIQEGISFPSSGASTSAVPGASLSPSTKNPSVSNHASSSVAGEVHAPILAPSAPFAPSAPPAPSAPLFPSTPSDSSASSPPFDDKVHYPSLDSEPVVPASEFSATFESEKKEGESSTCVVCLDAPVEGACVPCGHMAGCISCLTEIKTKKWGCPICRAKIDQIIRIYAV